MSASYTARLPLPDLIVQGQDHTLKCPIYRDGALVPPTEGTVAVYDAAGASVLSATITVVDGEESFGVASCVVPGTLTAGLQRAVGWRVEWTLTLHDGTVITPRNVAALVKTHLFPVITDQDIIDRAPTLTPRSNQRLSKSTTYQWAIDASWVEIQQYLWDRGNRPNLIVAPHSLRSIHLYKALELIYSDMSTTQADAYHAQAERYRELYREARESLRLPYDEDDDGRPDVVRPEFATWFLM